MRLEFVDQIYPSPFPFPDHNEQSCNPAQLEQPISSFNRERAITLHYLLPWDKQ